MEANSLEEIKGMWTAIGGVIDWFVMERKLFERFSGDCLFLKSRMMVATAGAKFAVLQLGAYQIAGIQIAAPDKYVDQERIFPPNQSIIMDLWLSLLGLHKTLLERRSMLGSGRRLADWIYVDDVVEGLLRAAVVPGIEGCAFDLGSGLLVVFVREIVQHIIDAVDTAISPQFGALPDRPFEQKRAADTDFLLNTLGYQPQMPLQKGLQATVTWYRHYLVDARERAGMLMRDQQDHATHSEVRFQRGSKFLTVYGSVWSLSRANWREGRGGSFAGGPTHI